MSNERIDLTKFEGITEGEWCYDMDAEWEDTKWYNDLTYKVPEDKRAEYTENTRKAYEKGQRDGLEPHLSPLIEQNGYGGDYSTFCVRILRGLLRGNEQDEFTTSDKIRPIPTPSEIRANARAIAAVPELIAELKRCYEEIDEVRYMLMQAYNGQKEREREIDYLRSYCLDNGVCPYCGKAQEDPVLKENLGILKMCPPCEDKIQFGIEPKDDASE